MRPKARLATICAATLVLVLSSGAGSAYTYKKLYDFCSKFACADGANPAAGLLADAGGNLFGTTINGGGGFQGGGTIFELSYDARKQAWKYQRLHDFCHKSGCGDGAAPRAALIMDVHGNLYGESAGSPILQSICGSVFELQPQGAGKKPNFVLLHAFPNVFECPQGGAPLGTLSYAGKSSGLLYDGTSPLYGAAENGGNGGLIFSLAPTGSNWTYGDIYDFCSGTHCSDGDQPEAEATVSPEGNLLGTTAGGGKNDEGTLYELSPGSSRWSEQVLYDFCSMGKCKDGYFPIGDLAADSTGAYFGTASQGGTRHQGCCGTLYKLTPLGAGWTYDVIHDFCSLRDCKDGAAPQGSLFMDSTGALYGATQAGGGHNGIGVGSGGGTVFRWNGTSLETLYAFCAAGGNCEDGTQPNGITIGASGNLFGTTAEGGKYGAGVVYELTP